jgi:hypothetical protein
MGQAFHIPAGATIRFGSPANPLPGELRERITRGLAVIQGIVEAHLPLCQVVGTMPEPAQILVVVLKSEASMDSTMAAVMALVGATLPKDNHLDVWPFDSKDPLLTAIRKGTADSLDCRSQSHGGSSELSSKQFLRRIPATS